MATVTSLIGGTRIGQVYEDGTLTTSGALSLTDGTPIANGFIAQTTAGQYGTLVLQTSGVWSYILNNASGTVQELTSTSTVRDTFLASWNGLEMGDIVVSVFGKNDTAQISGDIRGQVTIPQQLSASGQLTVADIDLGENGFAAQTNTAGQFGVFSIGSTGGWRYTLNPNSVSSPQLSNKGVFEVFQVRSLDGTQSTVQVSLGQASAAQTLVGGTNVDVLTGGSGNDTLTGGGANDTLNGDTGIDTAVFSGNRAAYTISQSNGVYTVVDSRGTDGTDTLTGIERLEFADKSVALDLTGNAGLGVKVLGALFGAASVRNASYVGIATQLVDLGASAQSLCQAGIDARLGANHTAQDLVKVLYTNVVGVAPSAGELAYWSGVLTRGEMTEAALTWLAADLNQNQANINLVGLTQTGVDFTLTGQVS